MGDPRRLGNKFERPKKLWSKDRIQQDSALKRDYGLKNTSEIWRAGEELKKYRREARRLLSLTEEERLVDSKKLLKKLARAGILKEGSAIDDVLSLEVRVILERRLQTLVLRKGLARTMKQARQLITHGFIGLDGRRINKPGYMVLVEQEDGIMYSRPIDISVKAEPEEASSEESSPKDGKDTKENDEKPAKAEEVPKEAAA